MSVWHGRLPAFFASDRIPKTWYDKRHNQMQTVTVR